MTKLITIFGATGQQGGALIDYILGHPRFSKIYQIRGVTRNTNKYSAKLLAERGVELVEADLNQPESLKAAVEGSHTVFAVTNYWDKASKAVEVSQGKAIADAAVTASSEILIWSSLPRIGLPNFDGKADVEDYIRTLPIKAAFFVPGWFMQNYLLEFSKLAKQDDGTYLMKKPWPTAESSTLIPLIDIDDTGKYLQPFLDDPEKYNHASLIASTDFYTPVQMCETWTQVTGYNVKFEGSLDDHTVADRTVVTTQDSGYYGTGSRNSLNWTLAQLEEKPNSWESFVKRHEPWFN